MRKELFWHTLPSSLFQAIFVNISAHARRRWLKFSAQGSFLMLNLMINEIFENSKILLFLGIESEIYHGRAVHESLSEGVIEYECRPVNSIPNKLYNYANPMTLNLPTKEWLKILFISPFENFNPYPWILEKIQIAGPSPSAFRGKNSRAQRCIICICFCGSDFFPEIALGDGPKKWHIFLFSAAYLPS